MIKSQVVVISGLTAGGKTTLVNALHTQLPNSYVISFDDYSIDALPEAPQIDTPVKDAVNRYDISALMADFLAVYNQYAIILIDFPFGNRNRILAPYIDLTVYIKTPLDICLARKILRDTPNQPTTAARDWAQTYLEFARPIFLDHEDYVSATANLVLDGLQPLSQKVQQVLKSLSPGTK